MTSDGRSGTILPDDRVAVRAALRRLAELREEHGGGGPTTLAGVLNLVAVAANSEAAESISDDIGRLADHHPSRTIILRFSDGPGGIDAVVSSSCGLGGAAESVCVETIALTFHERGSEGAASAVVPLLRSELPCFLWWPEVPEAESRLLRSLAAFSNRIITESWHAESGVAAVRALNAATTAYDAGLTDLAWAAITPWRQLLTQITWPDDIRALRDGPTAISVAFACGEPSAKSLLMAGWLRDALGDGTLIDLQARPGRSGRIESVALEGPGGLQLAVERIGERPAVALSAQRAGHAEVRRVLPLRLPERVALLAGELDIQGRDQPFERAAAAAVANAAV